MNTKLLAAVLLLSQVAFAGEGSTLFSVKKLKDAFDQANHATITDYPSADESTNLTCVMANIDGRPNQRGLFYPVRLASFKYTQPEVPSQGPLLPDVPSKDMTLLSPPIPMNGNAPIGNESLVAMYMSGRNAQNTPTNYKTFSDESGELKTTFGYFFVNFLLKDENPFTSHMQVTVVYRKTQEGHLIFKQAVDTSGGSYSGFTAYGYCY